MTLVQTLTGNANNKFMLVNNKPVQIINNSANKQNVRDTQIKDLMLIKLLTK